MDGPERNSRRGHSSRSSALAHTTTVAALLLAGALALVACGGGGASSVKSGSGGMATVKTASESGVGTVLTNASGKTLYLFERDHQSKVTCTGTCAKYWPPLEIKSGKPVAGAGVKGSMLGTIKSGGHTVVTYNGWPLYTYVGDSKPKQDHGEGKNLSGGLWYVVNTSGNAVKPHKAKSSGGGYGY